MGKAPKKFVRNPPKSLKYMLTSNEPQGYMHNPGVNVPLPERLVFRSHQRMNSISGVQRMAEIREVMDIREASEYLGVSRETLYKYVFDERIPAFKLGNRWKFKKTLLDRWMEIESTQSNHRTTRRKGNQ